MNEFRTAGSFSVKLIEKNGYESLRQCTSVSFVPGDNSERAQVVIYGDPEPVSDNCTRYANGKIFVMNEFGATVAKYDLD